MPSLDTICDYCAEPILNGESNHELMEGRYVHAECGMRLIAGSEGHIRKKCVCHGGTEEDPPGASKREGARAAMAAYKEVGRKEDLAALCANICAATDAENVFVVLLYKDKAGEVIGAMQMACNDSPRLLRKLADEIESGSGISIAQVD